MIDGYALLVVNVAGDKARVETHSAQDVRLESNVQWSDMEMHEQLLPDGLTDCLVMVFFSYHSYPEFNGESTEYNEVLNIEKYVIMQENYKEFERAQISRMAIDFGDMTNPEDADDRSWLDEMIEDWQLLHDEDLIITEETKTNEAIIQGTKEPTA